MTYTPIFFFLNCLKLKATEVQSERTDLADPEDLVLLTLPKLMSQYLYVIFTIREKCQHSLSYQGSYPDIQKLSTSEYSKHLFTIISAIKHDSLHRRLQNSSD